MTTTFDFPQAEILRRQQEEIAKQISEFNYWGDEVTQAIAVIMRIKEGVKTLGADALQQVVAAFRAVLDEAAP